MNAKELMIGDWVQINFRDKKVKVTGIHDGLIETNVVSPLRSDEYKPIPLTAEILEKIGYKHDILAEKALQAEGATSDSCVMISHDHRVTVNNASRNINSFNKWFVHIDTEDMRTMATIEISYVHELQRMLKLCGIEKEIVL